MGCKDSKSVKNTVYYQKSGFFSSSLKPNTTNSTSQNQADKNNSSGVHPLFVEFYSELDQVYTSCHGDLNIFTEKIEEKVAEIYISMSQELLGAMNHDEISPGQAKLIISEEILSLNLNILRVVGSHNNYDYERTMFKPLNKFQSALMGYLKAKYPRGAQSFVPGQLMDIFKPFDRTEDIEYDMLKKSNTFFGNPDTQVLTKQIKIFFNKIIDQLNAKYPKFENLMAKTIFKVQGQNNQPVTLNYKIGRKIPQNTPKYDNLESGVIQVLSPELFRVMIKWVQDLEERIQKPQKKIDLKGNFKCHVETNDKGQHKFDYINKYEFQDLINENLVNKISDYDEDYRKYNRELRDQLDIFNAHLLGLLNKVNRIQRYVPVKEMQVIKYSNFNTRFIAYMLAQKLTTAIQKLIAVGKSFKSQTMLDLDLVKFKVSDLMRCMVFGTKKEIIKVFDNFKKQENQNQIEIVKIKNRLDTPLNDAMIMFRMKGSYLLCECQLILTDGNHKTLDKRAKNVQLLNHFFYELERSPYGIMAEIAVILAYKDSKMSYEEKIRFKKNEIKIVNCERSHPKAVQTFNMQVVPFICSRCAKFYRKFENTFIMKNCQQCNIYQCGKCLFQENPKLQNQNITVNIRQQIDNKIKRATQQQLVQGQVSTQLYEYSDLDASQAVLKMFIGDGQKLKEKFSPKDQKNKVQVKELVQYISKKNPNNQYFVIVDFKKGRANFKIYRYDLFDNEIQNPANEQDKLKEQKYIFFTDYDILLIPINGLLRKQSVEITKDHLFVFISRHDILNKMDDYESRKRNKKTDKEEQIISFRLQNEKDIVFDFYDVTPRRRGGNKKHFKYDSLDEYIGNLPELKSAKSILDLDNIGLQTRHLNYFTKNSWNKDIKELKLSNNYLTSIDAVLSNCFNVERLYVNDNNIQKINFTIPLDRLAIFNASNNQIESIQNLINIKNVNKLLLKRNKLMNFDQCDVLKNLTVLNLKENYIYQYYGILSSDFDAIKQINLCSQYSNQKTPKTLTSKKTAFFDFLKRQYNPNQLQIPYPVLRSFEADNEQNHLYWENKQIYLASEALQKISMIGCKISTLLLEKACIENIQYIYLRGNKIENFDFLMYKTHEVKRYSSQEKKERQHRNLRKSRIRQNGVFDDGNGQKIYYNYNLLQLDLENNNIKQLPILKLFALQKLNLAQNHLKSIANLEKSKLPQLQQLELKKNQIAEVYPIKLPKLKTLSLNENPQIANIVEIFKSSSQLDSLETLYLIKCGKINFPFYSQENTLPNLKTLYLSSNQFLKQYPKVPFCNDSVETIMCKECTFINLPILRCKKLKHYSLSYSKARTFHNIEKSELPSLQKLELQYIVEEKTLDTDQKSQKSIENSKINENNNKKGFFNDKKVEPQNKQSELNMEKKLKCEFNLPQLKLLKLQNSSIHSMFGLSSSKLPKMEKLFISNIKRTDNRFPKINFPTLKQIYAISIGLKDLSSFVGKNLENLEKLFLSSNEIEEVTDVHFKHLKKLQVLKLNNCKLKSFFNRKGFDNLKQLDVENNQLENYPIVCSNSCKTILKGNNPFKSIDNLQQCRIPAIENLTINNMDLSNSKFPVLNMENLRILNLRGNKLKDISSFSKSRLPQIRNINVSQNEITSIPTMKFSTLKDLRLNKNKINETRGLQKSQLQSLNILTLSDNPLGQLPNVSTFYNLKKLWVNRAKLKHIPKLKNKNLELIQFQDNQLTEIEQFAKGEYQACTQFSVKQNKIKKIPRLNMPSVRSVYISFNQLVDIEGFCQSSFPNLTLLTLENNQLTKIPSLPFNNLEKFYLLHNPVEEINCFKLPDYDHLELISMGYTNISKMQILPRMPKLKKLWVADAKLTTIEWLINSSRNLPALTFFSGINNKITQLPNISKLNNLNTFYMYGNPITDISQFLVSTNISKLTTLHIDMNVTESRLNSFKNQIIQKGMSSPTMKVYAAKK